jgi:hypothetical protein
MDLVTLGRLKKYADDNYLTLDGTVNTSQIIADANLAMDTYTVTPQLWEREIIVEDVAADGDIAARVLYVVPTGYSLTLSSASIIPSGASAGIDASNTSVWTLLNGANTIVTKTFDDDPAFPADATATTLGTLDGTHKTLAADALLKLTVTNGTNANTPLVVLRLVGAISKV